MAKAKRTRRDKGKEAFWRKMLRQQSKSGLAIRAYCRKHHLGESLFYFWRREIARRDSIRQSRPFVPVRVREENGGSDDGSNVGVRVGDLEIVCGGGYRVRLHGPVDRRALREVLAVLEGLSSC
jgi:hypothetical protein